jgi:CubicO group peptidase (beta-lactamase class C family)
MAAGVVRGDQLVAIGSAGVRKAGDPAAFLSSDAVHLGSDTKAMTAMLIGRLIDRKQVAFESTMAELFLAAANMHAAMGKVTVRQLLTHTAGLPHDLAWASFGGPGVSLPEQRRRAAEKALAAAPGSPVGAYAYSNVGYVLLGAIAEAKTGKAWEEAIQTEVFEPLHMTAGFGPPSVGGKTDQPWGHTSLLGRWRPVQADNPPVMGRRGPCTVRWRTGRSSWPRRCGPRRASRPCSPARRPGRC